MRKMKLSLASLLLLLPFHYSSAAISACDEVVEALRSCMEKESSLEPLIKSLLSIPSADEKS